MSITLFVTVLFLIITLVKLEKLARQALKLHPNQAEFHKYLVDALISSLSCSAITSMLMLLPLLHF